MQHEQAQQPAHNFVKLPFNEQLPNGELIPSQFACWVEIPRRRHDDDAPAPTPATPRGGATWPGVRDAAAGECVSSAVEHNLSEAEYRLRLSWVVDQLCGRR
jgi:hypothetical protein